MSRSYRSTVGWMNLNILSMNVIFGDIIKDRERKRDVVGGRVGRGWESWRVCVTNCTTVSLYYGVYLYICVIKLTRYEHASPKVCFA